ncbi:MAG TPA: lysophospholipid acyltransferase family protein [Polyangiaceae bacterium]|nr:lysophospholipid acyltransferase family protein [Polyangiaceae bacterium]
MQGYSSGPAEFLEVGSAAPRADFELAKKPASLARLYAAFSRVSAASPETPAARAAELQRICQSVCDLHGFLIERSGAAPSGPAVFVSNHLGYIDPIVLCSLVSCAPIAKHEIQSWPCIGTPLARLNVTFVQRGLAHSGARVLKSCLRNLRSGVSVLNFPEGTTSRGGLLPFHLGAFWLARYSGVPLVPIAVDFETLDLCWVDDEALLPHYAKLCLGTLQGKRRKVRVALGEALDPAQFRSELDLCCAARMRIAELRRPYAKSA